MFTFTSKFNFLLSYLSIRRVALELPLMTWLKLQNTFNKIRKLEGYIYIYLPCVIVLNSEGCFHLCLKVICELLLANYGNGNKWRAVARHLFPSWAECRVTWIVLLRVELRARAFGFFPSILPCHFQPFENGMRYRDDFTN